MRLLLRFMTVICYWLPFTFFFYTCNKGDIKYSFAYNQSDADRNIKIEKESGSEVPAPKTDSTLTKCYDSVKTDSVSPFIYKDTVEENKYTLSKMINFIDNVLFKSMFPTNKSLSGIGCLMYYKNKIGKIVIAIALFCSLILLIAFKYIKSKRGIKYLLLISLLSIILFIIHQI